MNTETGYWFPWQTEKGEIVLEGPWLTEDKALAHRESSKRYILPPSRYGNTFYAASREEAEKRAKVFV